MDYLVLLFAVAAAVSAVLGAVGAALYLGARSPRTPGAADSLDLKKKCSELESALAAARAEAASLSEWLASITTEGLRQLEATSSKRSLAPVLLRLLEQALEPAQGGVFWVREAHGSLVLAAGSGLPEHLGPGAATPLRQGLLGFACESGVAVGPEDVARLPDLARRRLEATEPSGTALEVAAPMLVDEIRVGVLAAGGAHRRRSSQREVLAVLAQMGALALARSAAVRARLAAAEMDPESRLLNERGALGFLEQELERTAPSHSRLSLCLVDVDQFELMASLSGSQAATGFVEKIGKIIRASLREDDLAARIGRGRFLLILPGTGREGACRVAEELRQAVSRFPTPGEGGLTLSAGIATFPDDGDRGSELVEAAGRALAEAVMRGRNRVVTQRQKP
jgi:diguanylate cyclase (GGDEF)-like protein